MVGCFSIAQRQKRSNKSSFVWAAKSTVGHIIVAFLTSRYIRGNPHGAFCFMGRGNNAAYVEAFDEESAMHKATVQQPNEGDAEMHVMQNSDPYETTLPFPCWDIEEVDDAPPG